jgi:hypothetical protein
MEKKIVRIDSNSADLIQNKPPRELRPKCLQCNKTVVLRKTFWYDSPIQRGERPPMYMYTGESYFCCKNCAVAYAHKKAQEELGIKFQ